MEPFTINLEENPNLDAEQLLEFINNIDLSNLVEPAPDENDEQVEPTFEEVTNAH